MCVGGGVAALLAIYLTNKTGKMDRVMGPQNYSACNMAMRSTEAGTVSAKKTLPVFDWLDDIFDSTTLSDGFEKQMTQVKVSTGKSQAAKDAEMSFYMDASLESGIGGLNVGTTIPRYDMANRLGDDISNKPLVTAPEDCNGLIQISPAQAAALQKQKGEYSQENKNNKVYEPDTIDALYDGLDLGMMAMDEVADALDDED